MADQKKQKTGGNKKRSRRDKPARIRYREENRREVNKKKKRERHEARFGKQ